MSYLSENRSGRGIAAACGLLAALLLPPAAVANFTLRMQTDLGALDIELFDTVAPGTVTNFMNYVNRGDYDGTFIHRSVPGFVVQGGGFKFDPADSSLLVDGAAHITTDPPIVNEFNISNTRGTLAMAKLSSDPDSATSEWFFNVSDNSAILDTQNGGFTVFGQTLANGMDVIDEINGLLRCIDTGFPLCGQWAETPFADPVNFPDDNDNLILIKKIGIDGEGDGAIDALEDAAPNAGDGNNDGIQDRLQQHVASAPAGNGGQYIVVESQFATPLKSFNSVGLTFLLANSPSPSNLFASITFDQGYTSYDILNVTAGGSATVVLTLPAGALPDTFYSYGPTALNPTPHWYEFLFDGISGAEFNNNTVTLHFRDGARGDADGDAGNGVIVVSPGGPTRKAPDQDGDGVPDAVEDAAPNNGDANNDGTSDRLQEDVASYQDVGGVYITLEALPTAFSPAPALRNVLPEDGQNYLQAANPPVLVTGRNFAHGFVGFQIINVTPGDSIDIRMSLPAGEQPDTYFQFGATPSDPADHLYEFLFDAVSGTGAEFNANVITLNYVDGNRGDGDLAANGTILVSPGGSAEIVDADADGVLDTIEDAAPNNGDGNNDGTPDSQQGHVASFLESVNVPNDYITLEVIPSALSPAPELRNVLPETGQNYLLSANPLSILNGLNFAHGFVGFSIENVAPGDSIDVRVILPSGEQPVSYFQFGATPSDATDHLYEFLFDATSGTGAEFSANIVTLHFVDGGRGDSDTSANGVIVDPGGPALFAGTTSPSGGGGGCAITTSRASPWQAGGWWLLLILLISYRLHVPARRCR